MEASTVEVTTKAEEDTWMEVLPKASASPVSPDFICSRSNS